MRLQGTWTDGWTDGQGDSYIPPPNFVCGGYNYGQIGDQTGLFYTTKPVQYFIPVEIDLSVVPARLGISDVFTCPIGQP